MKSCTTTRLCALSGISCQAFYKGRKKRKSKEVDEDFIIELVLEQRKIHPRMGGCKLLYQIRPKLAQNGMSIGRDRFFKLLSKRGLLITPKRRWVKTTDSHHNLPLYRNLLYYYETTGPNQVWVSDITYVRTDEGWQYLSLVTDLYSRKIVGWNLGETLHASESVQALQMAIGQLPAHRYPIHHSDRGSQYCCWDYVKELKDASLSISMTEHNHCAENCYAERVNGILKNEYNLDMNFRNKEQVFIAVSQAIETYNHLRPHNSLGMKIPSEVHEDVA